MKKILIILAVIILILSSEKTEKVTIPKEAIRFRVIANSNNEEDQKIKKEITNKLNKEFYKLNQVSNIYDAKEQIELHIPLVRSIVEETLEKNKLVKKYDVNYGLNYFPEKEYNGVIYPEGEYESLVVTIGDGLGENFWCVLFPPLCLLEANETDTTDIEYTSFIKEVIEKYF